MIASLFVAALGLCLCCKESHESSLGIPRLFGPSEALVKDVVEFNCELLIYPENEHILLQLFKQGNPDKKLGEYTSLDGEIGSFHLVIKSYHEGNLKCMAKAQNNSNIAPTVSKLHHLKVIEPVKGAEIEINSGPELFEGTTLDLYCKLTAGNHVSYKWLHDGQLVSQSQERGTHGQENLVINRITPKDSGSYVCVATNHFNKTKIFTSNSSEVVITVKDLVSDPDISFTVLKEGTHNYSAMVTCQSAKGTPPVSFSLHNRTECVAGVMVEDRNATFKVPLVLGKPMGWLQCQANNGDQIAYSKWIPLEFVPVGGPVLIHYDYDVGENYAVIGLRFYCKAAKGSLPRYQWFLNKTLLQERGSFYYVVHQPPEQSILLLSVGRISAGTYHCEVSDSFDSNRTMSSETLYLDKEVLNRLPVLVVAVVFGCFAALLLLVSVCCCVGVVFKCRLYGEKSLLETRPAADAGEPELDLSDYNEDAGVVMTARGGDFDQASEDSADEWPQIAAEKKTLEDEAVVEL